MRALSMMKFGLTRRVGLVTNATLTGDPMALHQVGWSADENVSTSDDTNNNLLGEKPTGKRFSI